MKKWYEVYATLENEQGEYIGLFNCPVWKFIYINIVKKNELPNGIVRFRRISKKRLVF